MLNKIKEIKIVEIIVATIISLLFTMLIYNNVFNSVHYSNLEDFYVGTTIYKDFNKNLDVYIYFLYLFIFFLTIPILLFLKNKLKIFNFLNKECISSEQVDNFKAIINKIIVKIKPFILEIRNYLIKIQFIAAFGFILLHPINGEIYPRLLTITLILIAFTIFDSIKQAKNNKFSYFAITAILFVMFCKIYYIPCAPTDDHHFGETFATFFMHHNFHLKYYKDLMLVHGYVDVIPSWLGCHIFNLNNIEGYCKGILFSQNLFLIISILIGLFVFDKSLICVIPMLLLPTSNEVLIFFLSYFLLLKNRIVNKPYLWLSLYVILSLVFSLTYTTIGSFWVISSLPLALYLIYKNFKNKKIIIPIIVFAISLFICKDTLIDYIKEAPYYIKGTLYSFGNLFPPSINDITYAFQCNFALLFTPILILELLKIIKEKEYNIKSIFFCVFCILMTIVSLKYTLGRIDYTIYSRIQIISIPMLSIALPYYFLYVKNIKKFEIFVIICFVLSLYDIFVELPSKFSRAFVNKKIENSTLYNVGKVDLSSDEERNLIKIKDFVYHDGNNKTFFDLTNRGMLYLYLNKKTPIKYVSYYNSIDSKQAENSEKILEKNPPEIILIKSEPNNVHDRVFPPLRINYIYRWMLLNKHYKIDGDKENVFLTKVENEYNFTPKEKNILDFLISQQSIDYLPEVWANSIKTLPILKNYVNFYVENYPNEIIIRFYEPQKVKDIDLLYLNLILNNQHKRTHYSIYINDSNSVLNCMSNSGKLLIPMDNFPSWLLNENLKEIRIELQGNRILKSNIAFYNKMNNYR